MTQIINYTRTPMVDEYGKLLTYIFEFFMKNNKMIEVHAWKLINLKRKIVEKCQR